LKLCREQKGVIIELKLRREQKGVKPIRSSTVRSIGDSKRFTFYPRVHARAVLIFLF